MQIISRQEFIKILKYKTNHDFYVQNDTLLSADVFENFRNMRLKIYELDPAKFLSAPGLAWQAALKRIKIKLDLSTQSICYWWRKKV